MAADLSRFKSWGQVVRLVHSGEVSGVGGGKGWEGK